MEHKFAFKIVIAYENFASGIYAKEVSQRLAVELEPEFAIQSDLWKFEMLGQPHLREYAVTGAAEADMVIIAARGADELPVHVKNWIEGCVHQKRVGPAALVALLDQEEEFYHE